MRTVNHWALHVTDKGAQLSTSKQLQAGERVILDSAGITVMVKDCKVVHGDYIWHYESDCKIEDRA